MGAQNNPTYFVCRMPQGKGYIHYWQLAPLYFDEAKTVPRWIPFEFKTLAQATLVMNQNQIEGFSYTVLTRKECTGLGLLHEINENGERQPIQVNTEAEYWTWRVRGYVPGDEDKPS